MRHGHVCGHTATTTTKRTLCGPRQAAAQLAANMAPHGSDRRACARPPACPRCFSPCLLLSGADNEKGDLIVAVADIIAAPDGKRYEVLGHLGRGTFGQVLKVRGEDGQALAIKIIRNRSAFRRQAETEVELVRAQSPSSRKSPLLPMLPSCHAAAGPAGSPSCTMRWLQPGWHTSGCPDPWQLSSHTRAPRCCPSPPVLLPLTL